MKRINILIAFVLGTMISMAQTDVNKIHSIKKDFLIENLGLTSAESEKFFPIYFEYEGKLRELRKSVKSEKLDTEDKLEKILETKQERLNIEKDYYQKFKQVVPESKLVKLPSAEKEFRKVLMQRISK